MFWNWIIFPTCLNFPELRFLLEFQLNLMENTLLLLLIIVICIVRAGKIKVTENWLMNENCAIDFVSMELNDGGREGTKIRTNIQSMPKNIYLISIVFRYHQLFIMSLWVIYFKHFPWKEKLRNWWSHQWLKNCHLSLLLGSKAEVKS